ncbi:MAG: hypothetical protein HFJ20_05375 [Clostridia bacterium]|nr:hypothetical protein [Clostridia bacterium]
MQRKELLQKYKKEDERILVAKLLDKIEFCEKRNKIEYTDFLDEYQENILKNVLLILKKDFISYGGYEKAERKILILYPQKLKYIFEENKFNLNTIITVFRLMPLKVEIQKLNHRAYLGGLIKLGVRREKIGDIIIHENGADILIIKDVEKYLYTNICTLKRFQNSKIQIVDLENVSKKNEEMEERRIVVSSLRLDNIVSEICRTSRNKANDIIMAERVYVNGECITKNTKIIKENDKITIRGKGKFFIKEVLNRTQKGKNCIIINFYK